MVSLKINQLVNVHAYFDCENLIFIPRFVIWKNVTYRIIKVGLHHTFWKGDVFYHVFSVATLTSFLKLTFNTKNLNWRLEEVIGRF